MLRALREKTKTILWIVVVTFVVSIFAVWGMNLRSGGDDRVDEPDNVGTVNGIPIDRRFYSNNFQELLNQLRSQRGNDFSLSPAERYMLLEQAWEVSIQKILMQREIERLGITVTDEELVSFLRRNPHPSLQQVFTDDEGNFDYQAYLRALADPQADWTQLERWGRSIIPELKLQTMLAAQVNVAEDEIMDSFEKQNVEVKARYVKVAIEDEEVPYEPSEAEILTKYGEMKDRFTEPEKRRIELVKIEKKPSDFDDMDVFDRMIEIRNEILGGVDFAEAASNYSDDMATASKGGDLGFFGKSDMDSVFTKAAFSLKDGKISQPVRTQFGYHLIKVVERKTEGGEEKIRASHILMNVEPGYETVDSLTTLVKDLNSAIKERGFKEGAKSMHLAVKEIEPFARGAFIKNYGYLPMIVNFAFNSKKGRISSPFDSDDAIYYVKVVEEIPERPLPLEEVRDQIIEAIREERNEQRAKAIAEAIKQEAVTSGDLEGAAHAKELSIIETPMFRIDGPVPEIGTNTNFAVACHMLPTGKIGPPIKEYGAWYVIQVLDRTNPDMKAFAEQRETILGRLRQEKATHLMASWYEEIRDKAKIQDFRTQTLN